LQSIAQFFAVGEAELLIALPDRPSRDAFVEFFMANSKPELE